MRFLVIKTSALGDVAQALDALKGFEPFFKKDNIQLEWVVEKAAAPLVALHPLVSLVHSIDTKRWRYELGQMSTYKLIWQMIKALRITRYDAALDLQGNFKSALIMTSVRAARKVGYSAKTAPERPAAWAVREKIEANYQNGARDLYQQMFSCCFEQKPSVDTQAIPWRWELPTNETKQRPYGIVALGSAWKNKQINFVMALQVVKLLLQKRTETIFFSWNNEQEKQLCLQVIQAISHDRVQLASKKTLADFASWTAQAHWIVSADSFPLHLGALLNVANFGIFGPSSALCYGSKRDSDSHWQGHCPYKEVFERRCKHLRTCQTGACLTQQALDPLLAKINRWLESIR